jgi:hypothetical protein
MVDETIEKMPTKVLKDEEEYYHGIVNEVNRLWNQEMTKTFDIINAKIYFYAREREKKRYHSCLNSGWIPWRVERKLWAEFASMATILNYFTPIRTEKSSLRISMKKFEYGKMRMKKDACINLGRTYSDNFLRGAYRVYDLEIK